jgi:hypothetical protein
VTVPTPSSIESAVAPDVVQVSVLEAPGNIELGVAVNEEIVGNDTDPFTVTVTLALIDPAPLLAVNVYIIVAVGLTAVEVSPVTVPTP